MNKGNRGRKFSRVRDQRRALMRHLAESLVLHGRIITTEARAKELRPFMERWVTKARKGGIPARRMVAKYFHPQVTKKLMDEIAPRYQERQGGYTRVIGHATRIRDAVRMALIEFV
jgi:large subunit ribosomal protein L17